MKLFNVKTKPISESFLCLMEGRKADWIAQNMGNKLVDMVNKNNDQHMHGASAQEIADRLEEEGGKNAAFYAKLYLNGEVKKMEDFHRLTPLVKLFDANKMHMANKDLSSYSLKLLTNVLAPYVGKISHKHVNPAEDEHHLNSKTMTRHIQTPTFEVIVPHTTEASQHLGKGTRWCTAYNTDPKDYDEDGTDPRPCRFDDTNEKGDLYVIRAGKRRFQLHYEDAQFMDEENEPISKRDIEYLSGFPQYKDFLEQMIQKHHFNKKVLKNAYR